MTQRKKRLLTAAGVAGTCLGFFTLLNLKPMFDDGASLVDATMGLTSIFSVAAGYYMSFTNQTVESKSSQSDEPQPST